MSQIVPIHYNHFSYFIVIHFGEKYRIVVVVVVVVIIIMIMMIMMIMMLLWSQGIEKQSKCV